MSIDFLTSKSEERSGLDWMRRASAAGASRGTGRPILHLGESVTGDVRISRGMRPMRLGRLAGL